MSFLFAAQFLHAKTYVVANFDSGGEPLNVNAGGAITTTDVAIATGSFAAHSATEPARGNRGYSYKIQHINTSDAFVILGFTPVDLRGYRTLSFWIRGAAGGEEFKLDLRRQTSPTEPSFRPNVKEFMIGGVTTSWKKVNIPLKAIMKDLTTESYDALSDANGIVLNFTNTAPAGIFYIDDIVFHSENGNVMVDNFDDGSSPMAFGYSPFDFITGGTGASFTTSYDAGNAFGGSGNAYKIVWNAGTSVPSSALTAIEIDTRSFSVAIGTIGVDVFTCDTLSFQLKGEADASSKLIGVGLSDDFGTERIHPSSITITTSYQEVTRAMSGFAVNKDSVSIFEIWTINGTPATGPPINTGTNMTFYIDNVRFLDTSTPTVPSSLLRSNVAVANFNQFTSTDVLAVTASQETTDPTVERIRFEHDGMTNGATWTLIGVDTDTLDSTFSTAWESFSSLPPGNTYQVRAVAEDIAGNEGRMSAFTNITLPLVNSATGFAITSLTVSSIVWTWADNSSNESGFKVFSTSGGQVSPDLAANTTFWIEGNLTPNQRFGRFARPFRGPALYPLTSGATAFTLSNPVTAVSTLATTANSITISWSTGTGGNTQFTIRRAPDSNGSPGTYVNIATVTGNTFFYRDSGLAKYATFWYQVIGFNGDSVATAPSSPLQAQSVGGPDIAHTPFTAISVFGTSATVSATVSTAFELKGVTLMYRKKGDSSFISVPFSPAPSVVTSQGGLNVYTGSASIPSTFVEDSLSVQGFEYLIVSTDAVSASSAPVSGVYSVAVSRTLVAPPVGVNGGSVTLSDGDPSDGETSLIIPAGALAGEIQVTVAPLAPSTLQTFNNLSPVSAFEFGPTKLQFLRPITMTLLYADKNQDGVVDGTSIRESELKFFWYDGFAWRNLGGTVNESANTVSATVSHFSIFGLFPAGPITAEQVRPAERIITPNGDRINDFAQFGITGDFEIKILDVQGRRVRRLENVNTWDGRKDNGEYVESGVYVYQVMTGQLGEKVTGTLGVAR